MLLPRPLIMIPIRFRGTSNLLERLSLTHREEGSTIPAVGSHVKAQ